MGLTGHEGAKKYNMILTTVRELVHAARLDLLHPYHCVSAEDFSRIFVSIFNVSTRLALPGNGIIGNI
ncbi:hypothetical protein BC835DRAFT_1423385 [Cytidiella melzeri]|nr:hypothetical protein BC835DRAFT_1423385 [Cytidiella melzeri]